MYGKTKDVISFTPANGQTENCERLICQQKSRLDPLIDAGWPSYQVDDIDEVCFWSTINCMCGLTNFKIRITTFLHAISVNMVVQ